MSRRTGRRVQYAALPPATLDASLQIKWLEDAMRVQSAEAMRLVQDAGLSTLHACKAVPSMASCLKQQPGPTRTKPLTGP